MTDGRPVFVFGTGRCGSTHVQRLISLRTTTWIWGEHDGVLAPLMAAVEKYEASAPLRRTVFDAAPVSPASAVELMRTGSDRLSWLNALDSGSMRDGVAALIETMFSRNIPEGWDHWGFKEILYGLNGDSPRLLLDMFPQAMAVFSFREPVTTLRSMLLNWAREVCADPARGDELETVLARLARRYQTVLDYYLDLRTKTDRLVFVSADTLHSDDALIDALGLARREEPIAESIAITNAGRKEMADWAETRFDKVFKELGGPLSDLYARARDQSARDLAADEPDTVPKARWAAGGWR